MASTSNPFKQGQIVVPKFKGTDYKDWAYAMQAALEGVDLWLISGAPDPDHIDRPGFADPNAPTQAEITAQAQWDTADGRTIGYLKSYCERTVMERVLCNVVTAGRISSKGIWDELKALYDTTSATKVFALFRQTREWRLDANKHPITQLDVLDFLYQQLETNGVTLDSFIQAMTLLSAIPSQWEPFVTPKLLEGGAITTVTYQAAKDAVHFHWDSLQAQRIAKKAPAQVQKLSNVPRKGKTPSFQEQTAPHSGSLASGSKKKGKRGTRGKGKGKGKANWGKVHFISTASAVPNTAHSIATITPQGLQQCIAVEDPETSSFGSGPYSSFNEAITLAQRIGECPSPRTIQALEEDIIRSVPTPCSSPPPLSPESMDSRDSFGYSAAEREAISLCFLPRRNSEPVYLGPGFNRPHMAVDEADLTLEMMDNDRGNTPASDCVSLFGDFDPNDAGASGWDNLYQDDDGYAPLSFISHTATNSSSECAWTKMGLIAALGESERALLSKVACPCKIKSLCTCIAPSLDWMLDSGATIHVTPSKNDFIAYEPYDSPQRVRTASGTDKVLQILGHGTVLIQHVFTDKGIQRKELLRIQDVVHCPGVIARILSLALLLKEGLRVYGNAAGLTLFIEGRKNIPFMRCEPRAPHKSLYWLKAEKRDTSGLFTVFKEDYFLMHRRLGHPSNKVLRHAKESTAGFPSINIPSSNPLCRGCALGKMANQSFPLSKSRAKHPLWKIHSDLKSFPIESYHRHKYFISFVDDNTSFAWITLLRAKSSAITALHQFLAMIETQFGTTVREWMSDAGGEYKSDAFLAVLKDKGIKVLQSAPHTPQQNGRAERFNRTIMDKAEAMRHEACLPDKWWEFAVEHAVHIYNRTPVERLNWRTPLERVHNGVPDISHLRVFGCGAYAFVPPDVRKDKLAPKSELMIYLGVAEGLKAHRFMRSNGRLFYAAKALFDEELFPKCQTQKPWATTRVNKPVLEQPPHQPNEDAPLAFPPSFSKDSLRQDPDPPILPAPLLPPPQRPLPPPRPVRSPA